MVGGRVALDDGLLEFFACPAGTKEHESVVAVAASVNSAVSLCLQARLASSTFAYYHASFVLLFGSVLSMLYVL